MARVFDLLLTIEAACMGGDDIVAVEHTLARHPIQAAGAKRGVARQRVLDESNIRIDHRSTRTLAGDRNAGLSEHTAHRAVLYVELNVAPLASADSAAAMAGALINVDVLANDLDPDGTLNAATVRVTSMPVSGTVTVALSGVVSYRSNATFGGTDRCSYVVADNQGRESSPALVTVAVTAPPAQPTTQSSGGRSGGGGGGGGGTNPYMLLALCALLVLSLRHRRSHAK
jgi:hypothetical protein